LTAAASEGVTAAACQPYLAVTTAARPSALERALDLLRPACVLAFAPPGRDDAALAAICELVRRTDAPLLLADDWSRARETGCDGVHLADPEAYAQARRFLGADAIIGVTCGAERHAAIEAAEGNADYVLVGEWSAAAPSALVLEQIAWWSSLTTVPCVAAGGANAASWRACVEAGADFVAAAPELWRPPRDIDAAAIDLAEFFAALVASSGAVARPRAS
jgi:thiamine-phosphate pyrophosphorylase